MPDPARPGDPVTDDLLQHRMPCLNSRRRVMLSEAYAGKVLLVVNTASQCAFTAQYRALERLYQDKKDLGLLILGFPSNDFGAQEPGDEDTIDGFCRTELGVSFPLFGKIRVKGPDAHPFYRGLAKAAGGAPRWNFHKYLIGRDGHFIDHFFSFTRPQSRRLTGAINRALGITPARGR